MVLSRSHVLASATAVAVGSLLPRAARAAEDKVHVGTAGLVSDAPLFIADARGYYKEQNLSVDFVNLESGTKMIAPLGTGEIDAGAGAPSAALYNAVLRGINVRVVADKGKLIHGYGYNPLLVRKELVTSGRVKTFKDLKGLRFATAAPGSAADATLNAAFKRAGITFTDVKLPIIPFPSMIGAFANDALDAAIVSEPVASEAVKQGVAVIFATSDTFYLNQQIAVLLYGDKFIADRPDVAKRFMIAYVKALRFYYEALKDGRFAGPNAAAVIAILEQYSNIKNPDTYTAMIPAGMDPEGYVDVPSMNRDLAFWNELGLIQGAITAERVVDMSFVANANKVLGRYRRR
jgi:NitT/TauT family transport system substrate-binding protein